MHINRIRQPNRAVEKNYFFAALTPKEESASTSYCDASGDITDGGINTFFFQIEDGIQDS